MNIQKKQSLLRQKSLLNEELLAEYKSKMNKTEEKETMQEKALPEESIPKKNVEVQKSSDLKPLPESDENKVKNNKTTVASVDNVEEEKPSTSGIQRSTDPQVNKSPDSQVTKQQTRRLSLTKSDDKSNGKGKNNKPDTFDKMGRSKSKACSLM